METSRCFVCFGVGGLKGLEPECVAHTPDGLLLLPFYFFASPYSQLTLSLKQWRIAELKCLFSVEKMHLKCPMPELISMMTAGVQVTMKKSKNEVICPPDSLVGQAPRLLSSLSKDLASPDLRFVLFSFLLSNRQ